MVPTLYYIKASENMIRDLLGSLFNVYVPYTLTAQLLHPWGQRLCLSFGVLSCSPGCPGYQAMVYSHERMSQYEKERKKMKEMAVPNFTT